MAVCGVDEALWAVIMDGLVVGKYSLVLGAGASFGARNGAGKSIPTGNELRDELLQYYGMPTPPTGSTSLRGVYDTAGMLARKYTRELPETYLRRCLVNCSVPDWYDHLVRIQWSIIWNLNIDDVLERAYRDRFRSVARQELQTATWTDHQIFHREPSDHVTGVYLHGSAAKGDLIFGSLEYLAAVARGGSSHVLFEDSWPKVPFIAVGASFSDELDMAAPLSARRTPEPGDPPALVVLPSFSEYDEMRLIAADLVPVKCTAEEFFQATRLHWNAAVSRLDEEALTNAEGLNPHRAYRIPS